MALNGQTRSSPAPRSVAVPVAVILKRCSSVPAGACTSSFAGVTPPEPETSRLSLPVERTISVEPTGTATGPSRLRRRRRFAGMNAGQDDRRLAGISRRRHPGVDAEIRRQHHALPIERRGDAFPAFAAGGEKRGDAGDQHQRAQRIRIAPGDARRRRAGLERARRLQRALDMGVPQRERIRILRRDRELVGDRGRRTMAQAAAAIEPAQSVGRCRACAERRTGTPPRPRRPQRRSATPRGRAAAATATARARTRRGTSRSRSRASPAPATAAPRKSSSARAAAPLQASDRAAGSRGAGSGAG